MNEFSQTVAIMARHVMHTSSTAIVAALLAVLLQHGCAQPLKAAQRSPAEQTEQATAAPPTDEHHDAARGIDDQPSSGYSTADALIDRISSLPPGAESGELLAPAFAAQTPEGKQFRTLLEDLFPAAYEVQAAMMDQFGEPLAPSTIMGLDQFPPDLTDAAIVEETDERIVYEVERSRREKDRLGIVNRGGSWWIDLDDMSDQRRRSLPMLEKIVPAFIDVSGEFAGRVLRGEFATAAEANAAMQRAMAQAMMSRMGIDEPVPTAPPDSTHDRPRSHE